MPEGTKVGDVFVEGRLEYDGRGTPAFAAAVDRDMRRVADRLNVQSIFGRFHSDLASRTSAALKGGIDRGIDVDHNRTMNVGKAIGGILAVGMGQGISGSARFIRDAVVISMVGIGGIVAATLGAAIQAAFAVGPAILGTLPSLVMGVVTAFGILKLATAGVGTAMAEALGPTEAMKQKLDKFVPAVQAVMIAVNNNRMAFINFQNALQQSFWDGMHVAVERVAVALQAVQPAAAGVAGRFGDIARETALWVASAQGVAAFNQIFAGMDAFLNLIRPGIVAVVAAFVNLSAEGFRFAEILGTWVNARLMDLANWINTIDLAKVFRNAQPAIEDLTRIAAAFWGILKAIAGDAASGGGFLEFMADLAEAAERGVVHLMRLIQAFMALPPHIHQLIAVGAGMVVLGHILGSVAVAAEGMFAKVVGLVGVMGSLGIATGPAIAIIAALGAALIAVAGVFVLAWTRSEEFRDKIRQTFEMIKGYFDRELAPAFAQLGRQFAETFTAIEQLLAEFGLDWGDLGDVVLTGVATMLGAIKLFADTFTAALRGMEFMLGLVTAAIRAAKDIWNTVWEAARGDVDRLREHYETFVSRVRSILEGLTSVIRSAKDGWNAVWNSARGDLDGLVGHFTNVIGRIRSVLEGFTSGGVQAARNAWNAAWSAAKGDLDSLAGHWDSVKNRIRGLIDQLSQGVRAGRDAWNATWNEVKGLLSSLEAHWNSVNGRINTIIGNLTNAVRSARDAWNQAWNLAKSELTNLGNHFDSIASRIRSIWDSVVAATNRMADAVGAAFNSMREKAAAPIRAVVQFINDPLIKGYNVVAGHVGLGGIPSIAFARGGIVPGVGDRDTVPAMLTPGEGVLTKREMAALGGPSGFNQLRGYIQHFAGGGIVEQLSNVFGNAAKVVSSAGGAGFSGAQVANAAAIVRTGIGMGVPLPGLLIALMTAMQESGLNNFGHLGSRNDHDSLGLFQQRPSQGWGTPAQIMDPTYSATKFFQGLLSSGNWLGRSLTAAAQFVQRSAFPDAYAKHEARARALLDALLGGGLDEALSFFTDFAGKFIQGMTGEFPNLSAFGPWGQALGGMGKKLIEGAAKHLAEGVNKFFAKFTGGGDPALGSLGQGMGAISDLAKKSGIPFSVSSGKRNTPDYHGQGRALDMVSSASNMEALAQYFMGHANALLELIHYGISGQKYGVKNGVVNPGVYASLFASGDPSTSHRNHVHVAMDNGGVLPPHSDTLVRNSTSDSEYALTASHMRDIFDTSSGSEIIENHLTVMLDGSVVDYKIQQNEVRKRREALTGRRV